MFVIVAVARVAELVRRRLVLVVVLPRVGRRRAVVAVVGHAVAVVVGIAGVARAVALEVRLLGVRRERAVVVTVGHALATVTWMLAAAWLLLRGLDRAADADLVLRSGLVLNGVSVAKLFVYDLSALSGIVRSVAFIVTGLVLLATGTAYAKAWERRRATT